jgi:hypothetical protein
VAQKNEHNKKPSNETNYFLVFTLLVAVMVTGAVSAALEHC